MNGRGREAAHKAVNQIFTIDGGFSPKKKSRTGTWISASLRGAGRNVIGGSVPMTSNRVQVVAHPDIGKPAGVLIVEDETLIASFIDAVLGIAGFRVVGIAGSGPEALVLAAETRPALALIDSD